MSAIKKIWNMFTTVVVVLVVVLAMLLVGVRVIGLQVYTVLSGSMEPAYQTGSLIYVKKVDARTLDTGDVITFMMNEDTIATHRIAGVVPDEEDPNIIRFRTKGDANEFEDATLVHYKNVLGTPVLHIPKLGYFANFIQNPPGRYYAIAIVAILLLLSFLPDLFDDKEKDSKKKKSKSQDDEWFEEEPKPAPPMTRRKKTSSEPVAKNPPEEEKILRRKAPQDDKAAKVANPKKTLSDEVGVQTVRRETKPTASRDAEMYAALYGTEQEAKSPKKQPKATPVPTPPKKQRPAPAPVKDAGTVRPIPPTPVEEEMSFNLDDILAEFHNG